MVTDAEIAQFHGEADEFCEEVGGVEAAVDEDGTVDVGVGDWREDGGFDGDELVVDAGDVGNADVVAYAEREGGKIGGGD